MQDAGLRLALPFPALQWWYYESEYILFTLEVYLTTLFYEIFCFTDFSVWDGTGWTHTWTDTLTEIWTDRQTFLEKYYFR